MLHFILVFANVVNMTAVSSDNNALRPLTNDAGVEALEEVQFLYTKSLGDISVFITHSLTDANPVSKLSSERRGGRQCLRPASWQHTFGKQSSVLLHFFGN